MIENIFIYKNCNFQNNHPYNYLHVSQSKKSNEMHTKEELFESMLNCVANNGVNWAGGSGSIDRVVASDTRDPQFESSHWQIFLLSIVCRLRSKLAHLFRNQVLTVLNGTS